MVVVWGLPGVGKSELAVQYAQQYQDHYPGGVVRFTAAQLGAELWGWIQQNYLDSAEDMRRWGSPEQRMVRGWREWAASPHVRVGEGIRPVLVVIDNVTDLKKEVLPFLPKLSSPSEALPFRFLLTSRSLLTLEPGKILLRSDRSITQAEKKIQMTRKCRRSNRIRLTNSIDLMVESMVWEGLHLNNSLIRVVSAERYGRSTFLMRSASCRISKSIPPRTRIRSRISWKSC